MLISKGFLCCLILVTLPAATWGQQARGPRGVNIGGPFGVIFGGGRGLRIGGPDGVQLGGGQGARFGGPNGLQIGGGLGLQVGRGNAAQAPQPQLASRQEPATLIAIHHLESASSAIHFQLDGRPTQIQPGQTMELDGSRPVVLRLESNKRLAIRQTLLPGDYVFRQGNDGWTLVRSETPRQAELPDTNPASQMPELAIAIPHSVLVPEIAGPQGADPEPPQEHSVLERRNH